MNWQEITPQNRRTIIYISATIVSLIIILIVLLCVKAALDTANRPPEYQKTEQAPAVVVEYDADQHQEELHSVIKNKYGSILDGYEIAAGELLEDGSWYATTIQIPLKDQWSPAQDVYRIILHQVDGKWQIVAEPSLIFTYDDYPGIPRSVIYSANNL